MGKYNDIRTEVIRLYKCNDFDGAIFQIEELIKHLNKDEFGVVAECPDILYLYIRLTLITKTFTQKKKYISELINNLQPETVNYNYLLIIDHIYQKSESVEPTTKEQISSIISRDNKYQRQIMELSSRLKETENKMNQLFSLLKNQEQIIASLEQREQYLNNRLAVLENDKGNQSIDTVKYSNNKESELKKSTFDIAPVIKVNKYSNITYKPVDTFVEPPIQKKQKIEQNDYNIAVGDRSARVEFTNNMVNCSMQNSIDILRNSALQKPLLKEESGGYFLVSKRAINSKYEVFPNFGLDMSDKNKYELICTSFDVTKSGDGNLYIQVPAVYSLKQSGIYEFVRKGVAVVG